MFLKIRLTKYLLAFPTRGLNKKSATYICAFSTPSGKLVGGIRRTECSQSLLLNGNRARRTFGLLFALSILSSANGALPRCYAASTGQEKGLEIAIEADTRDIGFGNSIVDLAMTLIDSDGSKVIRNMRQKVLEVDGDGDKSLMVFDRPLDLKGTGLLTYTHQFGDDDQWLYLPSIKRAKRISSSNKSGPFLGSEFAFEDLSSQEVSKYTYNYLNDQDLDGEPCFVVERFPVHSKSGYTRQVTWVDKSEYRIQKIDYYDRKNELLKTLVFHNYKQYLDKYWRAGTMEMRNHQTGKSTVLEFVNYQFQMDLTERNFTKAALSRIR